MSMGAEAAGAYLWALRKAMRLSRDYLAKQFGTSRSQMDRLETGGPGEVASSFLLGVARYVGGDVNVVANLLLDPNATVACGREEAAKLLDERQTKQLHDAASSLTPEQVKTVLDRISLLEQQVRVLTEDREPLGPLE